MAGGNFLLDGVKGAELRAGTLLEWGSSLGPGVGKRGKHDYALVG